MILIILYGWEKLVSQSINKKITPEQSDNFSGLANNLKILQPDKSCREEEWQHRQQIN